MIVVKAGPLHLIAPCVAAAASQVIEFQPAIRDAKFVQGENFGKPRPDHFVATLDQAVGDPLLRTRIAIFAGFDDRANLLVVKRLPASPPRRHPRDPSTEMPDSDSSISTRADRRTRNRTAQRLSIGVFGSHPSWSVEAERHHLHSCLLARDRVLVAGPRLFRAYTGAAHDGAEIDQIMLEVLPAVFRSPAHPSC